MGRGEDDGAASAVTFLDPKPFRITLLSQDAKQLSWNHTLAEKPGGGGVAPKENLEVPIPARKQIVLT